MTNKEINIDNIFADKYRILRFLGEGGMGVVWLAENINTKEHVALKIIKKDFSSSKLENLLLFRKEADLLQGLDHPQIGHVLDFDFINESFYIAMEYIEGTVLQEYLEEEPVFPLEDFLDIAIQLSSIFSYIHEQNILHSDIKPNNIILQKDNERRIVKILDFGISLLLPVKINAFYRSIGTCAYMSPEQSGFIKRKIDHRSDLYSLGILFYRMLSGRLPYSGDNIYQLMHQHIASEAEPIRKYNPEVPPILEKVIFKLLSKDMDNRYSDGSVLATDLKKILDEVKKGKSPEDFPLEQSLHPGNSHIPIPFTGRKLELRQLSEAFSDACRKKGDSFIVTGESGVGKTHLIEIFQEYVLKNKGIFISANNHEFDKKEPFHSVINAAERFFEILSLFPDRKTEDLVENLQKRLGHSSRIIQETIPGIHQYLEESQFFEDMSSSEEKKRFDHLLVQTFLSLAETVQGVVLFIDNIQWADLGTLQFIQNFISYSKNSNILLIANLRTPPGRESEQYPVIEKILNNSGVTTLKLLPHTRSQIMSLLKNLVPDNKTKRENISEAVLKKTGGNIQFVKEILQLLNKKGIFDHLREFDSSELDSLKISQNRMEMMKNSLKDFPPQAHKLFNHMAVMGRVVMLSDLFECFSEIERDDFIDAISRGVRSEVISIKENTLTFTHGSFQKIFYEEADEEELKKIHLQVADYHEKLKAPNVFYLAHHYEKSGEKDKALKYLVEAGQKSLSEKSYSDALTLFEKAEKLSQAASTEQLNTITRFLGYTHSYLGNTGKARNKLTEALPHTSGKTDKSDILSRIAECYIEEGSYSDAVQKLEEAYACLGGRIPSQKAPSILKEMLIYFAHIRNKNRFLIHERKGKNRNITQQIKILERMDYISFWTGDMNSLMYNHFKSLNISRGMGATPEVLRLLCMHMAILISLPLPPHVLKFFSDKIPFFHKKAAETYELIQGVHPAKLLFKAVESGILLYNEGDTQNSVSIINKVMEQFWKVRTTVFIQEITSIYSQVLESANDFTGLLKLGEKTEELAKMFDNRIFHAYSNTFRGMGYLFMGKISTAEKLLKKAVRVFEEKNDKVFFTIASKYLIKAHYDTGEYSEGKRLYYNIKKFMKTNGLFHPSYIGIHHFYIEAESLRLIQKGFFSSSEKKNIHGALSSLLEYHQCFSFIRTPYLSSALIYYSAVKNRSRSDSIFKEGEQYFQYRNEPYNKGLFYLNRSYLTTGENKEKYLKKAYLLFHHCKAERMVHLVEQLLDQEDSSLISHGAQESESPLLMPDLKSGRELDLILEIGNRIGSLFELESLMSAILKKAMELVGAEQGEIIIQEDDKLNPASTLKLNKMEDIPACRGVLNIVRKKQETLLVSNAANDPVLKHDADVLRYNLKSILCTPMATSGKFLGMIYLANRQIGNLFTDHQAELVQALAAMAAVSVNNVLLLKKTTELRNRLSRILESIPSGIIAINSQGVIIQHNTLIQELIPEGTSEQNLQGRLYWEALPFLESCRDPFKRILMGKKAQTEIDLKKGDSTFTVGISPLLGEGIDGAVIKINDVTEEKKHQENLVQIQKMETVSTMVGGLAHDFNNTVTGISASAQYLKNFVLNNENPDKDEVRESLETIEEAVSRASGLVNQLLTFSMRKEVELQPIEITEVIKKTLRISQHSFDKRISFNTEISDKKAVILADKDQLEQVILNIMINAAHSMTIMRRKKDDWGGTLSVSFHRETLKNENNYKLPLEEGDYWKLTIKDTGVGMDKKIREKIFEPFFTTKRSGEGTGLGLSMAYSIMKRVNGFLDVSSQRGEGSAFFLYFPIQEEQLIPENSQSIDDITLKGDQTILIAEDENILRAALSKSLEACGFTILQAANGREAIEIFKENSSQIDLVLLDMVMPEKTGQDVFYEIRDINNHAEIILTSGFRKDNRVEQLLQEGIKYFLQKPYTKNELFKFIQKVLNIEKQADDPS